MPTDELIANVIPVAVCAFLALVSLGGAILIWWDSRLGRRGRRLARAAGEGEAAEGPGDRSVFHQEKGAPWLRRLERRLAGVFPNQQAVKQRVERAGMKLKVGHVLLMGLMLGAVFAFLLALALPLPLPLSIALGVIWGIVFFYGFICFMGQRRAEKFLRLMPDALDILIRSVRAGLPLAEGIGIVRNEMPEPIASEFGSINDRVHFGATLEEGIWAVADRVRIPEFAFLAVSVAVQRETGGNLTEALDNLAKILRQRQQMKLKIKALSAEARFSAYILGALPFVVAVVMYFTNPEYIGRLFTDPRGHILLAMGVASLGMGAFTMAKMIRFEI